MKSKNNFLRLLIIFKAIVRHEPISNLNPIRHKIWRRALRLKSLLSEIFELWATIPDKLFGQGSEIQ